MPVRLFWPMPVQKVLFCPIELFFIVICSGSAGMGNLMVVYFSYEKVFLHLGSQSYR